MPLPQTQEVPAPYAPQEVSAQEYGAMTNFDLGASSVEAPKKKKKLLPILLVALLALALVAGAVALALNWNNWFSDIPSDPAEYVAFLEEPNLQAATEQFAQAYGQMVQEGASSTASAAFQGQLKVVLGQQLLDTLSTAASTYGVEMDMAWLQEITLGYYGNVNPELTASEFSLTLGLGQDQLVSILGAMDLRQQMLYLAVPQMSPEHLKLDASQLQAAGTVDPAQLQTLALEMIRKLPSQEAVGQFLEGGSGILLKYMTDASKDTTQLQVGSAQKEVTVLTVKLTAKQLADMLAELVEYAKGSEIFDQIVTAYCDYMTEAGKLYGAEQTWDKQQILDALDQLIEDCKQMAREQEGETGNYLLLSTYVEGTQIYGRRVEVFAEETKDGELSFAALTQDDTVYTDVRLKGEDMELTLIGEGTKRENLLTGEYALELNGTHYATVSLTDVDTLTGCGTYGFAPSAALLEELELDGLMATLASTVRLELEVALDQVKLSALSGDTLLVSLEGSGGFSEGKQITLPESGLDLNDEEQLNQWVKTLKLDTVAQAVKNAGLPQEYHETLDALVQSANERLAAGFLGDDRILGAWETEVDITQFINDSIGEGDEAIITFEDLTLKMTMTFEEDGTYRLVGDAESGRKFFADVKQQMKAGMYAYMEQALAGTGWTVDDLLASQGYTMDSLIEEALPQTVCDQLVEEMSSEGTYEIDDGVLYMNEEPCEYEIRDNQLYIDGDISPIFPMTLTKVE